MEREQLIIHPAIHDPCNGDIIIELTDIQLHTNARVTQSVGKTIERSIESKQPGRIFFSNEKHVRVLENNTVTFSAPIFDPNQMYSMIDNYRKQGKRVFIRKPKEMPIFAGKDTIEFMDSVKGKRVLRRLEKKEQVG